KRCRIVSSSSASSCDNRRDEICCYRCRCASTLRDGDARQAVAGGQAIKSGQRWPAQQPTLRTHSDELQGDLDIPRPSGNDLSMDQINHLPALTQDEVRVRAWAEVREPLELQLAPLGRRALAALAPRSGESVLDIGCGAGETALDLAR